MSLLPDQASFEELVLDLFASYRQGGLMLGPLDTALLGEWAQADVPFEVVARGIRKAVEGASFDAQPGKAPVRSLRACRRAVEAELRSWRQRAAGRGEDER